MSAPLPSARRSTCRGSAHAGDPSGSVMSQNIRAVSLGCPAVAGSTWKVPGSGDEAVAARVREAEWLPLVAWSADQRLLQMDERHGTVHMAAAPAGDVTDVAAISVSARAGLRMSRDELKRWLPRYGAQVEQLIALLELREEFARQGHNTKALLAAAHQFQSNRSIDALGAPVCNTALSITSGTR